MMQHIKNTLVNMWILQLVKREEQRSSSGARHAALVPTEERFRNNAKTARSDLQYAERCLGSSGGSCCMPHSTDKPFA